jgi:hypothetical protein
MEGMQQFWYVIGIAFLPFVISVIFATTHCGSKRIPWILDIVALLIGLGAYFLVESWVRKHAFLSLPFPSIRMIIAALFGYLGAAIALPVIYAILYAMPAQAPRPAVVEGGHGAGHGHGADAGHGHGHDHGHGGGHAGH